MRHPGSNPLATEKFLCRPAKAAPSSTRRRRNTLAQATKTSSKRGSELLALPSSSLWSFPLPLQAPLAGTCTPTGIPSLARSALERHHHRPLIASSRGLSTLSSLYRLWLPSRHRCHCCSAASGARRRACTRESAVGATEAGFLARLAGLRPGTASRGAEESTRPSWRMRVNCSARTVTKKSD